MYRPVFSIVCWKSWMWLVKYKVTIPPNVLHFSFFLNIPSTFLHQGEVGIPGEQGEIGYKGDKVDHHCNTYVDVKNVHTSYNPPFSLLISFCTAYYLQHTHAEFHSLCCRTIPLQNDLARCVLSGLWKFLCKPFSFVCVCKAKSNPFSIIEKSDPKR